MEQVGTYNFPVIGKGTFFNDVIIQLADANDTPIDLTGATLRMHGKKDVNGSVVIDFQPTISDAANGEITVPGFTADYPVYQYKYDLFVIKNNEPEKYLKGVFEIVESVSL